MIKIAKLILSFSAIISLFGCTHNDEQKNQSSNNKNDTRIASSKNIIAYFNQSDKSIYTLTDFKSKKKLITVEDGNATWPIYSPDGNRIAFTGKVNGVLATYTMDSETGQNLKMITSPKGGLHEGVLDWQSDGSLICVTKNLDGNAEIYAVIDSTNMRNLTNHEHWDFFPLSHSNNMISFWTSRDDPNKDRKQYDYQSLYTINTDGTNLTKRFQIEAMTNESVGNGIFPAISPDGDTYVFMMALDLHSINMDGSNLKNLTQSDGIGEYFPFFSNNETNRIYFSSHDTISPSLNIYSIDLEGNNKKQHTSFKDEKNVILYAKFKPIITLADKK
jgi:Tol biopolymer transport system component|tara:strand:+ start:79 stop:1074 length:996 start_codon:yes stop_codon:yes gene_type:complete